MRDSKSLGPATAGRPVRVPVGRNFLQGDLSIPEWAVGVVLFAHGSGSSRHSPRNRFVADALNQTRLATLLLDLLTPSEEQLDRQTGEYRFDVGLLAERLVAATDWLAHEPSTRHFRVGYFGASTGAAGALVAAAMRPTAVSAIVSRGGRADLAGPSLARVHSPTLLIVGGRDLPVLALNRQAYEHMNCEKALEVVPGASHLFQEPGALEDVARLASDWFASRLPPPTSGSGEWRPNSNGH